MTQEEVDKAISEIPVGSRLQLIKNNGDIIEVVLASHDTSASEKQEYGNVVVPALPSALIVQGGRWGTYRLEIEDIIRIARIG